MMEAMMPEPLNEQERRVLEYIVEYLRSNTYQPSIREIGREFAIKSTKTVSELLQALADKGWIERDPSRSRGVRVIGMERPAGTVSLPLVAADLLPGADYFELDRRFAGAPGSFLFPMPGGHLNEHGIRAGDLLLVEPVTAQDVQEGDIVVARFGDTTSVRRVSSAGAALTLEPGSRSETSVDITRTQAETILHGRVSGVVRRIRAAPSQVAASALPLAR
jgi:repressor LexA